MIRSESVAHEVHQFPLSARNSSLNTCNWPYITGTWHRYENTLWPGRNLPTNFSPNTQSNGSATKADTSSSIPLTKQAWLIKVRHKTSEITVNPHGKFIELQPRKLKKIQRAQRSSEKIIAPSPFCYLNRHITFKKVSIYTMIIILYYFTKFIRSELTPTNQQYYSPHHGMGKVGSLPIQLFSRGPCVH